MSEIPEPDWQEICMRLWRDAQGGYGTARPETVRKVVNEIDAWIEQEALHPPEST